MTMKKIGAACALLLALVLARPSFAAEPLDNTAPWSSAIAGMAYTDVSIYMTKNIGGSGWPTDNTVRKITPAGDVDYFVISCGKTGGTGLLKDVQITFTHAVGDLDMYVYSLDGQFAGSSTGVGNYELVNVSAQKQSALVVKVYGYNSAVNVYGLNVNCQ
jgi:hypothetical protein